MSADYTSYEWSDTIRDREGGRKEEGGRTGHTGVLDDAAEVVGARRRSVGAFSRSHSALPTHPSKAAIIVPFFFFFLL